MTDLIVKTIHDDKSETVIKRVRPKQVINGVSITSKHEVYSVFVSSSSGCPYECTFCQLTENEVKFNKLSEIDIYYNVVSAIKSFGDIDKDTPIKLCWMGMGDASVRPTVSSMVSKMLMDEWNIIEIDVSTINVTSFLVGCLNDLNEQVPTRLFYSLPTSIPGKHRLLIPRVQGAKTSLEFLAAFNGEKKIHYTPLKDVNDTPFDYVRMAEMIPKGTQIRLLEYNAGSNSIYTRSENLHTIYNFFVNRDFDVKWQISKGHKEKAACGQFL